MIKLVILITGARKDVSKEYVYSKLDPYLQKYKYNEIILIHGGALGVDSFAGMWTDDNGVHEVIVPAKWNKYSRKAGGIRNELMVIITTLFKFMNIKIIAEAFPSKDSIGTLDCIKRINDKQIELNVNKNY